jgi:hypothetical protein
MIMEAHTYVKHVRSGPKWGMSLETERGSTDAASKIKLQVEAPDEGRGN